MNMDKCSHCAKPAKFSLCHSCSQMVEDLVKAKNKLVEENYILMGKIGDLEKENASLRNKHG